MQRRAVITLGLSAAAAAALPPGRSALAQARGEWTPLFNGRNLEGWTPIGGAIWTVEDGVVQADNGVSGHLVSNRDYGDVEIWAEFWISEEANSGIFIRASDPAQVTPSNAYEVNIWDRRPDITYGTGAIVDIAPVSPMPLAGGRWSVMRILAEGDRFTVEMNGARTVENAQDARYARGRITLQYGSGVVKFRRVEVREL